MDMLSLYFYCRSEGKHEKNDLSNIFPKNPKDPKSVLYILFLQWFISRKCFCYYGLPNFTFPEILFCILKAMCGRMCTSFCIWNQEIAVSTVLTRESHSDLATLGVITTITFLEHLVKVIYVCISHCDGLNPKCLFKAHIVQAVCWTFGGGTR